MCGLSTSVSHSSILSSQPWIADTRGRRKQPVGEGPCLPAGRWSRLFAMMRLRRRNETPRHPIGVVPIKNGMKVRSAPFRARSSRRSEYRCGAEPGHAAALVGLDPDLVDVHREVGIELVLTFSARPPLHHIQRILFGRLSCFLEGQARAMEERLARLMAAIAPRSDSSAVRARNVIANASTIRPAQLATPPPPSPRGTITPTGLVGSQAAGSSAADTSRHHCTHKPPRRGLKAARSRPPRPMRLADDAPPQQRFRYAPLRRDLALTSQRRPAALRNAFARPRRRRTIR